jgi:adenylate kinase family enzyme
MSSDKRIHILGASGSGTTTLGANLALRYRIKYLDTDSFFWIRSRVPFTEKRPVEERLKEIRREIEGSTTP